MTKTTVPSNGPGKDLPLTEAGRLKMAHVKPLPTGSALGSWWKAELPETTSKILGVLLEAGAPLSKEKVGEIVGLSSTTGSFGQHLAKLRRLNLIHGPGHANRVAEELKD